jgi:hypothetical protein
MDKVSKLVPKSRLDAEVFFHPAERDAHTTNGLTKYVQTMQAYFDEGLLEPASTVLGDEHKSFVIDSVLGITEESQVVVLPRLLLRRSRFVYPFFFPLVPWSH